MTTPATAACQCRGSASLVLAWPAAADPPSREEQVIVHVDCTTQGAFGAAHLGLEHISTNRGAPGGDLRV